LSFLGEEMEKSNIGRFFENNIFFKIIQKNNNKKLIYEIFLEREKER